MEKRQLEMVALHVGAEDQALLMIQNEGEEIQKYATGHSKRGLVLMLPGEVVTYKATDFDPVEYMCCGLVDKIRDPNIQIEKLTFATMRPALDQRDRMFRNFSDLMRTEIPHQLEVRELQFVCPSTETHIQQVLPFLKPGFLREITFGANNEQYVLELNSVTQTEQWLQAKMLWTRNASLEIGVEALDHFESVMCDIESSWGVAEVDHMVKLLLAKDHSTEKKTRKITGPFIRRNHHLISDYFKSHQITDFQENFRKITVGNRAVLVELTYDSIRMTARDIVFDTVIV